MKCSICNSLLTQTNIKNKIIKEYNYYCKSCNSYHIIEEFDASDFYANKYHTKFSYSSLSIKLINKMGLVRNRIMGRFFFLNKYASLQKGMHFLEIGGAMGEFYNIINKKFKPKTYTIVEPDKKFNRNKKNLNFINDMFEDIEISTFNNVDVVTMFHVLEHIYDLDNFLNEIKKIKPLYFYFEVPNCENKVVRQDSLIHHPHYHHFSKQSINILLSKNGFKKVALDTIEPISYHPYKKIKTFERYRNRFSKKNEIVIDTGLFLRGIYTL